MPTYLLHGLTFASERPLPEHEDQDAVQADVRVRVGPELDAIAWDGDHLLADASPFYRVLGIADGYLVAFADTAEFAVSAALDRIEIRSLATTSPAVVDVLLVGTVIATLLALRGECMLHAAAVEVDRQAVIIAGPSGAGKTTLAAAMCAAGGRLVSDDALRISNDTTGGLVVHPGTRELRLREQAMSLAATLDGPKRLTADQRTAVRVARTRATTLPVHSVLLPRHEPGATVTLRELSGRDLLVCLLGLQRTLGWRVSGPHQTHFAVCAKLAAAVCGRIATVPRRTVGVDAGEALMRQVRGYR